MEFADLYPFYFRKERGTTARSAIETVPEEERVTLKGKHSKQADKDKDRLSTC